MSFDGAMAALTSDGFRRENGGSILIQSAWDKQGGSRVAQNTFLGDGTREIRIRKILVARRKIVRLATAVVSQGRLEEMPADVGEIAAGVCAGTNDIFDAVVNRVAPIFPPLPIPR